MSDQTTIPEGFADLLEAPFTTIATLGKRRRTCDATRRDLFVLDPQNPMHYLEVRGDAQFADDADYAFAESLGRKYRGMWLRQMDGDDRPRRRDHPLDPRRRHRSRPLRTHPDHLTRLNKDPQ